MTSEATKKNRKGRNITLLLDILMFMGTCAFLVIFGFCSKFKQSSDSSTLNPVIEAGLATYGALLISLAIGCVIVFFIRNKARNTVWMINLVLSVYLFGVNGMWVILAIWAADEFVVCSLYKHFREKLVINKEIDKRS